MPTKPIIKRIIIYRKDLLSRTKEAIIRRLPRTVNIRSGLSVHLRHWRDNDSFWGFFTGPEYMLFIPGLSDLKMSPVNVIDCGAGNGLFSLWIEHFRRLGILDWKDVRYTLIEPSLSNVGIIKKNMKDNLPKENYEVIRGLVGQRDGSALFYESKDSPWSSSMLRKQENAREVDVPFADLSPFLKRENVFLKLDIEGTEFSTLENYGNELSNIKGLVIEWHREFGYSIESAKSILKNCGLSLSKKSSDNKHVLVEFYKR